MNAAQECPRCHVMVESLGCHTCAPPIAWCPDCGKPLHHEWEWEIHATCTADPMSPDTFYAIWLQHGGHETPFLYDDAMEFASAYSALVGPRRCAESKIEVAIAEFLMLAHCVNCGASYAAKWSGTTCLRCDGDIK